MSINVGNSCGTSCPQIFGISPLPKLAFFYFCLLLNIFRHMYNQEVYQPVSDIFANLLIHVTCDCHNKITFYHEFTI